MHALIHALGRATPLGRSFAMVVVVVGLFVLAWVVGRAAARVAAYLVDRSDRRRRRPGEFGDLETGVITGLRQRETAISLIETTVRYLAFAVALVLSAVVLSGAQRL